MRYPKLASTRASRFPDKNSRRFSVRNWTLLTVLLVLGVGSALSVVLATAKGAKEHDGLAAVSRSSVPVNPKVPPLGVPVGTTYTVNVSSDIVNVPGDLDDANIGDGTCADMNGKCSLRAALEEANAIPGDDTITFDTTTGHAFDSATAPHTISLTMTPVGELPITEGVTINGPGANLLTIDANHASRVFNISGGVTVALDSLTIANGSTSRGGGIYNSGTLSITNSTLSGNSVIGGDVADDYGGGIFNDSSGNLTISNSTLSGNSVSGGTSSVNLGGGIFSGGTLTITNSTLSTNSVVSNVHSTNLGGGIFNGGGTLNITNSTLSGNFVGGGGSGSNNKGGGIFNDPSGNLTITNSTLSGNSVSGAALSNDGGGISNSGTVTLNNSTISNNLAIEGAVVFGGGIHNDGGTVSSRNTIIAGNTGFTSPDVAGTFNSLDYNLIGNTSGTTISGTTTHNILNQSANLDPLDNYGGPTQTHRLQSTSPAIDAGDNCVFDNSCLPTPLGFAVTTDQRGTGFTRKAGTGSTLDIGAFEVQDNTPPTITAGGPLTRQQPSAASNSTIATVDDTESGAGGVTVTATTVPTGISVTSIVNNAGTVTADVAADCTATLGDNTVVLTATDGGGATATANLIVSVTAASPPPITPTPAQVCANSSGNTASGPAGMTSYAWGITNGTIASATNTQSITYTAGASGSVTLSLTVTAPNGCIASGSTPVSINPIPATPTITPGGPTTFCQGGSLTLTSSSATGNQWLLNGNPIGGENSNTYNTTTSGSYTVMVTDGNGCTSSTSNPIVVTVNPLPPTPTITPGGPTTFCQGGSTTLTSSSASGNQWRLNGNPIGGATNSTFNATASGNYTVTVIDGNGCVSGASAPTTVTVNPNPSAAIAVSSQVCGGSTGNAASVANAGVGATYVWGITNGTITGGVGTANITFTGGAAGTLTLNVTVTTAAGCSDSKSANVRQPPPITDRS